LGLQHLGFVNIFLLNYYEGKKLSKKRAFIFPNGRDKGENGWDWGMNGVGWMVQYVCRSTAAGKK